MFFDRMSLVDSLLAMFGVWSLVFSLSFARSHRTDMAMLAGFAIGGGLLTKSPAIFFYLWLLLCFVFPLNYISLRKDAKKIVTDHDGLTESFCGGFNDQTTQDGEFPDGVVGVVTGYITEDDGQGKSDIKVFVSVTLLVEAEDAGAAESFETPVGLLTTLADVMGTIEDECLLSLDGDWEVVDVEKVQTKAAVSINTPARRVRQDLDPEYGRGYDPTPDLDAHTAFFC